MTDILDLLRRIERIERELEALQTIESGGLVAARYQTDAGQSISNSTWTIVDFEDQTYDTHSAVTVGASWKFTAPVNGYYRVSAYLRFAGTTTWAESEAMQISLFVNGSARSNLVYITGQDFSGGSEQKAGGGVDDVYLSVNDYIDIRVYQSSGAALALNNVGGQNRVNISRIG